MKRNLNKRGIATVSVITIIITFLVFKSFASNASMELILLGCSVVQGLFVFRLLATKDFGWLGGFVIFLFFVLICGAGAVDKNMHMSLSDAFAKTFVFGFFFVLSPMNILIMFLMKKQDKSVSVKLKDLF